MQKEMKFRDFVPAIVQWLKDQGASELRGGPSLPVVLVRRSGLRVASSRVRSFRAVTFPAATVVI